MNLGHKRRLKFVDMSFGIRFRVVRDTFSFDDFRVCSILDSTADRSKVPALPMRPSGPGCNDGSPGVFVAATRYET